MHMRILPPRQSDLPAPGNMVLEEAAVATVSETFLHEPPGAMRELDCRLFAGCAKIPGEREQHESLVVAIARLIQDIAVHRNRAIPATVGRGAAAGEKAKAMRGGLGECGLATEHERMAEDVGQSRLNERCAVGA